MLLDLIDCWVIASCCVNTHTCSRRPFVYYVYLFIYIAVTQQHVMFYYKKEHVTYISVVVVILLVVLFIE
jgi:hypothetical protein